MMKNIKPNKKCRTCSHFSVWYDLDFYVNVEHYYCGIYGECIDGFYWELGDCSLWEQD